jgi:hypothetical protein
MLSKETRMDFATRLRSLSSSWTAVAFLTLPSAAAATCVNLSPSKDNTLISAPVGNSNGAGDGVYVGKIGTLGSGTLRRGLIAFDLSSIPAGSTIQEVTLTLEMVQSPNDTDRVVTLHRVSADWGEAGSFGAGSGSLAQPNDATWVYRFFDTQPWVSAGGDFTAGASASQTVGGLGTYAWTGPGLVADVQAWINDPASNFGWLLKGDEIVLQAVKKFSSKEGLTPPRLTVDCSGPTDVPTGPGFDAVWFAQPHPSPAFGPVSMSYRLPRAARVSLSIHDALGRVVRRVTEGVAQPAGRHAASWDGRTHSGEQAASGLYLVSLVVDGEVLQRRIPLLR